MFVFEKAYKDSSLSYKPVKFNLFFHPIFNSIKQSFTFYKFSICLFFKTTTLI